MADKTDVKEDEVLVDEAILEGCLIVPFVKIPLTTWAEMLFALPSELRREARRSSSLEHGYFFVPRPIWLLVKSITEVRTIRH